MNHLKTALKYLVPLIIAVLLVKFILTSIDPEVMMKKIAQADGRWVALTVFISLIAHLSRAYRWNLLMKPLGFRPALSSTFIAVMVAYFGNIFLPRMGEVLRCVTLTRIEKVPFNSSFGTVVAERAFDFICLLSLVGLSLVLEFERFSLFFNEVVFNKSAKTPAESNLKFYLILGGVVLVSFVLFLIFRNRIFSSALFIKIKTFLKGILEGVFSIRKLENKGAFLFHTFVIWACYFLMTYLAFFALPSTANLGPLAGLVILIVGGLGMSAPASGGIGPFHIMVAGALTLFYGLSKDDGVAYAFVIHTSQFASLFIIGGICAIISIVLAKKRKGDDRTIVSEPLLQSK
ncbi:MAG TPA: lysylphosphatidylglycerol synthase transmembrane domain-containing protein [Cytophagaceae bacterium]|jgi:hypothetical protein